MDDDDTQLKIIIININYTPENHDLKCSGNTKRLNAIWDHKLSHIVLWGRTENHENIIDIRSVLWFIASHRLLSPCRVLSIWIMKYRVSSTLFALSLALILCFTAAAFICQQPRVYYWQYIGNTSIYACGSREFPQWTNRERVGLMLRWKVLKQIE